MELNDSNHVAIAGSDDKRQITLSLVESQSGILKYNETHWSNEAETLRLLDDVIKP